MNLAPGRIFYLVICIALGVGLGWLSAKTGIKPASLALGLLALMMMLCCTFAPLFIDNPNPQAPGPKPRP